MAETSRLQGYLYDPTEATQEDRGRIRADDVYPEYWLSTRMTAETRASGHCMCDLHMHMGRYDHPEVVLTLFTSIGFQSYAVESQIQPANNLKRIGNVSCRIQL
jgi:hypothetical protein